MHTHTLTHTQSIYGCIRMCVVDVCRAYGCVSCKCTCMYVRVCVYMYASVHVCVHVNIQHTNRHKMNVI